MGETPRCPDCGSPLSGEGWSEELCPHCLLRLALEESSGAGPGPDAATAPIDRAALSRGQILGSRYGIRKFLGRGGMGEVWQAFDLKLRVDIALKTVRAELAEKPQVLETLRQEVRAAREVVSPNVCRVYDLQELGGRELVSMEYVDGATLLQVLEERGPIELQEAREIAAQFLSGLDAIHRAGLVHRDIKPENLMITRTGRVVVMDFGIAKGLAAGCTGPVAGTPAYMSPEQARGAGVDARADVFSAGVVLAEMLAPGGMAEREAREVLWRGIRQDPPQVPESPWREVIEVAVAAHREKRYAAASALARALEEVAIRVEGAEDVVPYPGLLAFTERDREYFFGRELEAEALWRRIRKLHLLALVGPSGAGKTSFLRAGLLASAPAGWGYVICTPGESPLTALRQALAPELSGDSDAIRDLVKVEDPEAMVSAVSRWRKRSRHALLVVDQFEELFTLNPPEVQAGFATLLGRLAVDADVRVLLSLRDDFLIHCHAHEALEPILSELTLLGPPSGAALRRALVQPALKCGYRFEDEALVDRMLSEVKGERAALPLLAFAAEQLWQRRDRQAGALTGEAYELIGGVSGALAQHAEQTLERIGSDKTPVVRELFRNLVTAEGTRSVRDREELLSVFQPGRQVAARVLDALIEARLLTSYGVEAAEGSEEKQQRIEIVHESLLTAWPRLVRWQAQDVEGARMRDDLRQAARRWQERDRPDDLLWVGSAYRDYQSWRERYPGSLSQIEQAYADALAAHAARGRRRRRLVVSGTFVALAAVAVAIGVSRQQAVQARGVAEAEARRAEAGKLLALGRNQLEADTTAALAYARASLGLFDTPEARRFVVETLWQGPVARLLPPEQLERQLGLPRDPEGIAGGGLSPDGRWLIFGLGPSAQFHHILLLDRDGGPPRALPHPPDGTVNVAAIGPRSDLLIIGGSERNLRLLSLPDLKEIRSVPLAGVYTPGGMLRGDTLLLLSATAGLESGYPGVIQALTLPAGELRTVGINRPYEYLWGIDPSGTRVLFKLGGSFGLRSLDGGHEQILWPADEPKGLSFFPQGDRVAIFDMSTGETRILPLDDLQGPPLRVLQGPAMTGHVGFGPEGRYLTQASGPNNTVHIWDLEGPPDAGPTVLRRGGVGERGGFTPDARWRISFTGQAIEFWAIGGPLRREFPGQKATNGLAFTADGRWLAACHGFAPLRLLPLHAADGGARLLGQPKICFSVATHPTEDLVLESTQGANVGLQATVLLHSLAGPSRELTGDWPGWPPWALAFDATGRRALASAWANTGLLDPADRVLRTWDLASGRQRVFSVAHLTDADWKGFGLSVAPDGTLFAGGQGGVRKLLLPEAPGEAVKSETVYEATFAMGSLSRAGHQLLVAVAKEMTPLPVLLEELVLLDLERGTSREITTHGAEISRVLLSPSGRAIVTASPDGTVRVGPATGGEPHLLLGHEGRIQSLAISPDERWIASASDDAFYIWDMPDVTKPPLHTLPHEELLAKLDTLTNLRVVGDAESSTGWKLDVGPFPGWKDIPTW